LAATRGVPPGGYRPRPRGEGGRPRAGPRPGVGSAPRGRVPRLPGARLIASGLAASACDPGNDAGATPPTPLSLPTPSGPDATAPPGTGGGLASKLDASATPAYLRQVAASTRLIASGRVKMVAAAVGGKGREGQTTELSVLEGQWDNPAGRSRLRLDPTGAIRNGDTGISALLGGPVDMIQIGETE